MMTNVVLIDAGRSAVIPDDLDQPETPTCLTEDVIQALLRRSQLSRQEITGLFLADPRCLPPGDSPRHAGSCERSPLGLTTTICSTGSSGLAQAVTAIAANPKVIALVAGTDSGLACSGEGGNSAEVRRRQRTARSVAACWAIEPAEMDDWARLSFTRADECSTAGDFQAEIVHTTPGYRTDRFRKPDTNASCVGGTTASGARGTSAMILTSEANAIKLGLRFRARLQPTCAVRSCTEFGIAPPSSDVFEKLLAGCGLNVRSLDQLEVPERHGVTPVAWIKETGINEGFVNPRGGDLAFGYLRRSGHLRSLVTMLNSLEATGGRAGAVVACRGHRAAAFVLSRT